MDFETKEGDLIHRGGVKKTSRINFCWKICQEQVDSFRVREQNGDKNGD